VLTQLKNLDNKKILAKQKQEAPKEKSKFWSKEKTIYSKKMNV